MDGASGVAGRAAWNVATARRLNSSLPFDSHRAILFVRESVRESRDGRGGSNSDSDSETPGDRGPLRGDEARQFYEEVVSTPEQPNEPDRAGKRGGQESSRITKTRKVRRLHKTKSSSTSSTSKLSLAQIFRSVQDGDLSVVESCISSGDYDINTVDQFNWTLLMCASHAGHMHIVQWLLSHGAQWREHVDKRGHNAVDLSLLAGHSTIAQYIESKEDANNTLLNPVHKTTYNELVHSQAQSTTSGRTVTYYCDVCKETVSECRGGEHSTSTSHQFSCQHTSNITHSYGIPHSNRGYQMMLRGGWDPEGGLGVNQEGKQFPVKTILKRDRLGFGSVPEKAGPGKARVTHFAAFDAQAVKRGHLVKEKEGGGKVRAVKKRDILRAAAKDRQWEVRMRRYLNTEHGFGKYC